VQQVDLAISAEGIDAELLGRSGDVDVDRLVRDAEFAGDVGLGFGELQAQALLLAAAQGDGRPTGHKNAPTAPRRAAGKGSPTNFPWAERVRKSVIWSLA
jgi:hypothetical protein